MRSQITLREAWTTFRRVLLFLVLLSLLGGSTFVFHTPEDRISLYTNPHEFDFLGWTLSAVLGKLSYIGLGTTHFLDESNRTDLVREYLILVGELQSTRSELEAAFGDPDPARSAPEVERLTKVMEQLKAEAEGLRPLAEIILQEQVAYVLADLNLGLVGIVFPPVAFEFAQLPSSLIVSPRDIIRQDASISLRVDLSLQEKVTLEERVEQNEDISALVVPVGGLGTYPTMILESTALSWITEVIVHEWVHNYLAFRPLGLNYSTTSELRTMNETTASLVGLAVGREVLARYYPDLLPPAPPQDVVLPPTEQPTPEPPSFDFRAEMRITRLKADQFLEEGEIERAEEYMEARRLIFWENGYRIRKLNQAYFAFYGAYADEPGGAAGDDPVGEAVRALWEREASLASFLRRMARMNSYKDLLSELGLPTRN